MATMALLSILVTPFTELGKCLVVPLKRQISYLINFDKNVEKLRNQASHLSAKRNDVQSMVDEARRKSKEINQEVLEWLQQVDTARDNFMRLDEQVRENKRCFKGLCPDWTLRRRLSSQAVQMLPVVNELLARGNFSTVSHDPAPPSVVQVRTHQVDGLSSRDLTMNQVMKALSDECIRSIGLYGMGGIGKSTLVHKLNNELQGSQLFKKVIMVTVSSSPDFKRIQDEIGARLGLKLEAESDLQARADKLFKRLQDEGSVLIILDDVWKKLQIAADIGIPSGIENIGCKVIITTRIRDVCREMGIQIEFKVEALSEEESWVLFKEKVGNVVTRPALTPLAQKIVRKCQGSPLAIVTLGSSLRDVEEEFEWKHALRALENPDPIELEGIIPEVIRSLRYSYDHLKGSEIKFCFLFFCLFPEDYDIPLNQMRDYGIGEGFLKVETSLEDASNKLLVFVRRLKDCGLLLDGDEVESVKMHDVVRDVAISIASEDENGFLVKTGVGSSEWPETEKLNRYKRISFMKNSEIKLQSPLECPRLRTLLLTKNRNLEIIEDNFFERMKALTVLDLSGTSLKSIKSLGDLTNLRTLYLERCYKLTSISVLGELKNLQILRLSESGLRRLGKEIGNLTNLRCLDLTVTKLQCVEPNVLSRLTKLEELLMQESFGEWEDTEEGYSNEGGGGGEMKNASFAEVASLPNLVKLQIPVRNKKCASTEITSYSWENLKEFAVFLGPTKYTYFEALFSSISGLDSIEEQLINWKVVQINGVSPISQWVKILCKKANMLWLKSSSCHVLFNNLVELDAVRWLGVGACDEIEYLMSIGDEDEGPKHSLFGRLEGLEIKNMRNMKKIVHGLPPPPSLRQFRDDDGDEQHMVAVKKTSCTQTFQNLQILIIRQCNGLKNLFSFGLARCLQQLEMLYVSDCDELGEIIAIEEDEEEEAVADHQGGLLPKLSHLKLEHLECLTSICQGSFLLDCHLKHISVYKCPNLKRLPFRPQLEAESYPVDDFSKYTKWGVEWDIGSETDGSGSELEDEEKSEDKEEFESESQDEED